MSDPPSNPPGETHPILPTQWADLSPLLDAVLDAPRTAVRH